jgi:COMPASS component SWD1
VEENVEYIEHEDEFDIHPIEEIHKRRLDLEDEQVDVLAIEPAKSEHDEEAFSMPVLLDIVDSESEEDIVAVGPGTMRRRSPGEGREWMSGTHSGDSGDERGGVRRSTTNGVATASAARSRRR